MFCPKAYSFIVNILQHTVKIFIMRIKENVTVANHILKVKKDKIIVNRITHTKQTF